MSAPDLLGGGRRFVFDLETNGLLDAVTVIHCAVLYDIDTDEVLDFGPDQIGDFLDIYETADTLIGHNIIGYDCAVIEKLHKRYPKASCELIDTINLAKLCYSDIKATDFPLAKKWKAYKAALDAHEAQQDRWAEAAVADGIEPGPRAPFVRERPQEFPGQFVGAHSLEAWGYRLGTERKGDYSKEMKAKGLDPWAAWNPEMHSYMIQDGRVNVVLYRHLMDLKPSPQAVALEMRVQALCSRMERNGWPFNVKAAEDLYGSLAAEREQLGQSLRSLFPPWVVQLEDFIPKRDNKAKGYIKGVAVEKFETVEFNPASRQHIENRLRHKYAWAPTEFTPSGQAKIDDDVLQALPYPEAKQLARYFMLQKRIGQLAEGNEAWLRHVSKEGKIHARYNVNGTVTGRAAHSKPNVGQVPAVGAEFGRECRALFTVPAGWRQLGADQSGLELRALASYLKSLDGGDYEEIVLNGDIHWENAKALFGLLSEIIRDDTNPQHKKWRGVAKTFIYAFLYGSGPENLGFLAGVSDEEVVAWLADPELKRKLLWTRHCYIKRHGITPTKTQLRHIFKGEQLTEKFLKGFPALGKLIKIVKAGAKKKYLKGLDGRSIPVRGEHSALNSLLQSAGAVICKQWIVDADDALRAAGFKHGWDGDYVFLGWIHDELQIAVRDGIDPEEIGRIVRDAGRKAGAPFKQWKCPLDVEFKIGADWAECH